MDIFGRPCTNNSYQVYRINLYCTCAVQQPGLGVPLNFGQFGTLSALRFSGLTFVPNGKKISPKILSRVAGVRTTLHRGKRSFGADGDRSVLTHPTRDV